MALLNPGPFGNPRGKIGNMVIYPLNGQIVCRMIGEQPNKPTTKQNANRMTMEATMSLLKPLQKFIKQGFEHKAKGTVWNPFNLATSYNKKNAIVGSYPDISIDYTKVKLSSGELPGAKDISITKEQSGLMISWDPTHQWAGDQYDDLVMIALYYPSSKSVSVSLNAGKRESGSCFIPVEDESLLNGQIEAYLCFKSADAESISDSIYIGSIHEKALIEEEQKESELIKINLTKVQIRLEKHEQEFVETGKKSSTHKNLEKKYQVLQERLNNLRGKPG